MKQNKYAYAALACIFAAMLLIDSPLWAISLVLLGTAAFCTFHGHLWDWSE